MGTVLQLFDTDIFPYDRFMKYMGSKRQLLSRIYQSVHLKPGDKVLDLFSGSGIVAAYLRYKGLTVHANDIAPYSFIVNDTNLRFTKGSLQEAYPDLDAYLNHVNSLTEPKEERYFSKFFSGDRNYFSLENALRIDAFLEHASQEPDPVLRNIILSDLFVKITHHASISGTFVTFLKDTEIVKKFSMPITISGPMTFDQPEGQGSCMDAKEFLDSADDDYQMIYLDPPYNNRQYSRYYHLLEQACKPFNKRFKPKKSLITGVDPDSYKSTYSQKENCLRSFTRLFDALAERKTPIVLSYTTDGLLAIEQVEHLLSSYGDVEQVRLGHRKYFSQVASQSDGYEKKVWEHLYVVTF